MNGSRKYGQGLGANIEQISIVTYTGGHLRGLLLVDGRGRELAAVEEEGARGPLADGQVAGVGVLARQVHGARARLLRAV